MTWNDNTITLIENNSHPTLMCARHTHTPKYLSTTLRSTSLMSMIHVVMRAIGFKGKGDPDDSNPNPSLYQLWSHYEVHLCLTNTSNPYGSHLTSKHIIMMLQRCCDGVITERAWELSDNRFPIRVCQTHDSKYYTFLVGLGNILH